MPTPDTVRTADYYDVVHRASWSHRTASTLAGGTLGVIYGSIVGVVAAFLPALFSALHIPGAAGGLPGLETIGKSMALFAGVGGFSGIAGVTFVGGTSGAVAAGFAEKEKRELLQKGIAPEVPVQSAEAAKAAEERWTPKIFNWRTAAVTTTAYAAFGAIVGATPLAASAAPYLGFTAGSGAAVAGAATIAGMMGAYIGFKNSLTTNLLVNFYMKAVQGKFFGGDKLQAEAAQAKAPETAKTVAPPEPEPAEHGKTFTTVTRRFSLQAVIEGTEHADPGLTRIH